MNIAFSHRVRNGISVAIATQNSHAYLSMAFVRDGDQFDRAVAR